MNDNFPMSYDDLLDISFFISKIIFNELSISQLIEMQEIKSFSEEISKENIEVILHLQEKLEINLEKLSYSDKRIIINLLDSQVTYLEATDEKQITIKELNLESSKQKIHNEDNLKKWRPKVFQTVNDLTSASTQPLILFNTYYQRNRIIRGKTTINNIGVCPKIKINYQYQEIFEKILKKKKKNAIQIRNDSSMFKDFHNFNLHIEEKKILYQSKNNFPKDVCLILLELEKMLIEAIDDVSNFSSIDEYLMLYTIMLGPELFQPILNLVIVLYQESQASQDDYIVNKLKSIMMLLEKLFKQDFSNLKWNYCYLEENADKIDDITQ